jgi:hypothetical protein
MATKRTYDDVAQDGNDDVTRVTAQPIAQPATRDVSTAHRDRRLRQSGAPIFRASDCIVRFFPSIQTVNAEAKGIYNIQFRCEIPINTEFVCSNNADRPLLTFAELRIPADSMLTGVTYMPRDRTPADSIREYTHADKSYRIADTQCAVTGSISVDEMAPFTAFALSARSDPDFRVNALHAIRNACGDRQAAFDRMIRTVAQRETFEETGFFSEPDGFEFVEFRQKWAIFKVHISRLRARSYVGCMTFVTENRQSDTYFLPVSQNGGRGIPLKVQVYIYGTRAEFRTIVPTVRFRPHVEEDIGGIMLYEAKEIGKFRVV